MDPDFVQLVHDWYHNVPYPSSLSFLLHRIDCPYGWYAVREKCTLFHLLQVNRIANTVSEVRQIVRVDLMLRRGNANPSRELLSRNPEIVGFTSFFMVSYEYMSNLVLGLTASLLFDFGTVRCRYCSAILDAPRSPLSGGASGGTSTWQDVFPYKVRRAGMSKTSSLLHRKTSQHATALGCSSVPPLLLPSPTDLLGNSRTKTPCLVPVPQEVQCG